MPWLRGGFRRVIKGLNAPHRNRFAFVQDLQAPACKFANWLPAAPPHCGPSVAALFSGAANSFSPTASSLSRLATASLMVSSPGLPGANRPVKIAIPSSMTFHRIDVKLALGHRLDDVAAQDQMAHVGAGISTPCLPVRPTTRQTS